MTRSSHRVIAWILNLLVPGTGWVLAGRIAAGVAVGLVWGVAAGGVLVGFIWPDMMGTPLRWVLGVAAAALYVVPQVALYGHLAPKAEEGGRDDRFKAALVAYLAGRLDQAEAACKALLRDDPDDVEAMLQLASVSRRRGRLAEARQRFLQARYLDDRGRWDAEIGRELAALDEVTARLRKS
jgi:hypothetical protein